MPYTLCAHRTADLIVWRLHLESIIVGRGLWRQYICILLMLLRVLVDLCAFCTIGVYRRWFDLLWVWTGWWCERVRRGRRATICTIKYQHHTWLHVGCDSWRTNRLLCVLPFEKVLNRAGELGESEYGLNADASEPPVGEGMGMIGLFKAIVYQHSGMS